MNGSSGNDSLLAFPSFVSITGPGFFHQDNDFDVVNSNGRGGVDEARMYDSSGDETFSGFGNFGQMVGVAFTYRVLGFASVRNIGTSGGTNRLVLSTSNPITYDLLQFGSWV